MLIIGICDTDSAFIEELHNILHKYLLPITDWEFFQFRSGDEVIAAVEANRFTCNLLFMDISMPGYSGIDTAQYLYNHHVDTDIIFITDSKDYVFESYRCHAFSYLLKPLSETDITAELTRYLSEIAACPRCLNVAIRGITYRIPIRSIIYIESDCRKSIIHTLQKDYICYEKLSTFESVLKSGGFIRCHQSYLVPVSKLTSYHSKTISIDNFKIPVSRKYQDTIELLFSESFHSQGYRSTEEVMCSVVPDFSGCHITNSLTYNRQPTGALVCVQGIYLGSIIRIYADCEVQIGRDGARNDIVINLPKISRKHCTISYHSDSKRYYVTDWSHNGTFLFDCHNPSQYTRLTKGESHELLPGSTLYFGDKNTLYRLL